MHYRKLQFIIFFCLIILSGFLPQASAENMGRSIRNSESLRKNKDRLNFSETSLRNRLRARLDGQNKYRQLSLRSKNNFRRIARRNRDSFKRRSIISDHPRFRAFR
jgi:hypothetical protein